MKDWQFTAILIVALLGALVMLFSDYLGIVVRPEVATLFGLMLAFVYQQKKSNDKKDKEDDDDGR